MNRNVFFTYSSFKKTVDIILSILISPAVLLLSLFMSVLVLADAGFPLLYIDDRVGFKGNKFKLIKFRTMKEGKKLFRSFFEKERMTRSGKILKRFHLDEILEIYHILRGEMSFVGPRPLLQIHLNGLDSKIRKTALPGITCLAQLELYRFGRLDKHKQIELDNEYVSKMSLYLDVKILIHTLVLFFNRKMLLDKPMLDISIRNKYLDKYSH